MTGFAQLLDDLQVLRGTEKGRNVRGIKWLSPLLAKSIHVEPENATQSGQIPED